MQVGMMQKVLTPSMEYGEEPDLRAEVLGSAAIVCSVSLAARNRMA
jgi:hypothetical protein